MRAAHSSARPRVLIVDDDPLFRSLLSGLLQDRYEVLTAADGCEGFHKALEHPPAGALIDVRMPNWDGIKTARAFESHPTLRDVPLMLLISSAADVAGELHLERRGYLTKTRFTKVELQTRVERLVSRRIEDPAAPAPAVASGQCPIDADEEAFDDFAMNRHVFAPHPRSPQLAALAADDPTLREAVDYWE